LDVSSEGVSGQIRSGSAGKEAVAREMLARECWTRQAERITSGRVDCRRGVGSAGIIEARVGWACLFLSLGRRDMAGEAKVDTFGKSGLVEARPGRRGSLTWSDAPAMQGSSRRVSAGERRAGRARHVTAGSAGVVVARQVRAGCARRVEAQGLVDPGRHVWLRCCWSSSGPEWPDKDRQTLGMKVTARPGDACCRRGDAGDPRLRPGGTAAGQGTAERGIAGKAGMIGRGAHRPAQTNAGGARHPSVRLGSTRTRRGEAGSPCDGLVVPSWRGNGARCEAGVARQGAHRLAGPALARAARQARRDRAGQGSPRCVLIMASPVRKGLGTAGRSRRGSNKHRRARAQQGRHGVRSASVVELGSGEAGQARCGLNRPGSPAAWMATQARKAKAVLAALFVGMAGEARTGLVSAALGRHGERRFVCLVLGKERQARRGECSCARRVKRLDWQPLAGLVMARRGAHQTRLGVAGSTRSNKAECWQLRARQAREGKAREPGPRLGGCWRGRQGELFSPVRARRKAQGRRGVGTQARDVLGLVLAIPCKPRQAGQSSARQRREQGTRRQATRGSVQTRNAQGRAWWRHGRRSKPPKGHGERPGGNLLMAWRGRHRDARSCREREKAGTAGPCDGGASRGTTRQRRHGDGGPVRGWARQGKARQA